MIEVENLCKTFTLHNQGGVTLPVLDRISLSARAGECLALNGPSGSGKSTVLRCIYATYRSEAGVARVRHGTSWVDMAAATPRQVLAVRRASLAFVTQFLRVIPRVAALDIVMEPLLSRGAEPRAAESRARALLERLNVPERLWQLPPATFSGGEQQRVNIAHGFSAELPVLLLDEPTAALDAVNRRAVIELIDEAKQRGAAVVGIFHDHEVRSAVADRVLTLTPGGQPS